MVSGAIFSLLANEVLEKKGIVYGVAMNTSCTEAEYIGITEKQDLEKLLGSKYLQAKIKNIFKNVRENLVLNKLVLFTGTGCQINGLKKFLQKDYKNLICVDIICHESYVALCRKHYKEGQLWEHDPGDIPGDNN